jgi:hypothetical protein
VIHVSVGWVSVLLSHIVEVLTVTTVVGEFTLWIIISFMGYIFQKIFPPEIMYLLMFVIHFIVMATVI